MVEDVVSSAARPRPVRATQWWAQLGPGLVTGASDDDPSGIATYSQVGARFGFALLWSIVLTLPLMVAIQTICARVGAVTHKGLAANLAVTFPRPVVAAAALLLLAANLFNIAADLNAMADCLRLVFGGSILVYVTALGIASLLLQLYATYRSYVRVLKWLTLSLFAYVAAMLMIHVPWHDVGLALLKPPWQASKEYLTAIVAIFGTTISPYMFFWQASHEVERAKERGERRRRVRWQKILEQFRRINLDTWIGMALSNLIAFCIMVTTAVVLNAHGKTDVQTTVQAAQALEPVAGKLALDLFALGIVGTGLLALPVLAGSAGFAIADTFGWRAGLNHMPEQAGAFYSVIGVAMLGGLVLCLFKLDPIRALYWSAVINGIVAVPIMALLMSVAQQPNIMGEFPVSGVLKWGGWSATIAMTAVVIAMFVMTL